jgi:UDP-4-amino-4,6-dideoxy-N-acetyl-beta-L-altrosamine transaminase
MKNNNLLPAFEGGNPVRTEMLEYFKPSIDKNEIDSVVNVLRSGWLTYGEKSQQFEKEFARYVNSKYSIAVNSCTSGLHLCLVALGVGSGDEVITTPYTFAATSEVIIHVGAKPIFVDVDQSMNIDVDKIENKITSKTKAIIPVHFGGQPCDMGKIMAISKRHNIPVIEDAAHASGSSYNGKKIGSIGEYTVFSFYANKNMTTAEGGIVTTDNKEIAEKIRLLSLHGISRDAWNRFSKEGSWFYEIHDAGYKYNFTDLQAALGISQLEKLDEFNSKRKNIAKIYINNFSSEMVKIPVIQKDILHSWHLFPIIIKFEKLKISRNTFIEYLQMEGIQTSVHYIPLHLHPYYQKVWKLKDTDFPIATNFYDNEISLPIYPKMSRNDAEDVILAVNKIIDYYKK